MADEPPAPEEQKVGCLLGSGRLLGSITRGSSVTHALELLMRVG